MDSIDKTILNQIKDIVKTREPNKINSLLCNFTTNKYDYSNLMNYWKMIEKNDKDSKDELYLEYKNIKNFNNGNIGICSLFYFKKNNNFLALAKKDNGIYYMNLKCDKYQDVLSNAINNINELFILSYWII